MHSPVSNLNAVPETLAPNRTDAKHQPSGAPGIDRTDEDTPVRVIRSARRTKTSSARLVDGVVEVRIPATLTAEQEHEVVEDLRSRLLRRRDNEEAGLDLYERAVKLANRYDLPEPTSVSWVSNQHSRWASCTPQHRSIRVSRRLMKVPDYVLDYVLVHELAHIDEANHSSAFRDLENRFPKVERATGFLEALGLGLADRSFVAD